MKFKVKVDEFQKALNEVKDTTGSEKTGNEGLRIFADAKGRVRLTTNDGSYATDTWVKADVKVAGEIILMTKLFVQYFQRLDVAEANFELNTNLNLVVTTKRGKQTFNRLDADKFTMIIEEEPDSETDISGKTFKQMINGVAFATGESKERPVLEGIHLISNGKISEFITTDGSTIASIKKKISLPKGTVTMGKKTLTSIARSIRDDEKVTYLQFSKAMCGVRHNDTTHVFPTFVGTFPNVKIAIDKANPQSFAVVDRLELISLLERAVPLCQTFAFMKIEGSKVTIKGDNSFGSFNEFMFAGTEGEPAEIRFPLKDLINIAKNIQDDNVEIGIEKGKPITLRPDSKVKQVCLLASMA